MPIKMSEGKKEILLGDCLELMKDIPSGSIDMILCDLPYGTTNCKWDTIIPFNKLWEQYERIIKQNGAIVLTASQPFTSVLACSNLKLFKYEMIWEKPNPSNPLLAKKRFMSFHENILVFYKKQPTYTPQKKIRNEKDKRKAVNKHYSNPEILGGNVAIEAIDTTGEFKHPNSVIKINRQQGLHPTQKPVQLFETLIKSYTHENDLVLDNCAGSGTTAIACLNTNRQFIVMEKEQKYYDIILKRIADFNKKPKQQTLFDTI
jgi:site-specific DNA-methyltransferase (adenine-specific)